ncbi:MAG TPA: hypothetical protein VH184_08980, partial [Dongiaceae bacterium]|nr:hypothetical protein [Dongiaceae bacterium]
MARGISQRALAELAGIKQQSVHKAVRRGLIDLFPDGSIDRNGAKTVAWLDGHRQPAVASAVDVSAVRLVERSGSLREREYDLEELRANSVCRHGLRAELLAEATEWRTRMAEFPAELAELLAPALAVLEQQLAVGIAAHMASYLQHRPPEAETIDKALQEAAAKWRFYPPRRLSPAPPLPLFRPPVSLAEAAERHARAKAEQHDRRARTRAGELLTRGAADMAAGGLRWGWIQASEEFLCTLMPTLLSRLGIPITRELEWACELVCKQHLSGRLNPIWPGRLR